MNLLLDTHVLLWLLAEPERLDESTHAFLADPDNLVYVSAVSGWEIAIKAGLGKLRVPRPVRGWLPEALAESRLAVLPITLAHGLGVEALAPHHPDPFDRLLIAQATIEGMPIVTADPQFDRYDVPLIRC